MSHSPNGCNEARCGRGRYREAAGLDMRTEDFSHRWRSQWGRWDHPPRRRGYGSESPLSLLCGRPEAETSSRRALTIKEHKCYASVLLRTSELL